MKLETKNTENYFSFFFKTKIPLIKRSFNLKFLFYKTPDVWVHGYSSRTESGKYVLFHDYDNLDLKTIIEELQFLQKKFNLSNYFVFELDREKSFHAVCLDTFSLSEAYEIQKTTSCDLSFIHSIKNLRSKEWVLRIGKKGKRDYPKFIKTIKGEVNSRIKSNAHGLFLVKFGVPENDVFKQLNSWWDNNKKISFIKYNTFNRVE